MAKASIFCPYCHSESVISRGKDWQCKDCNRFWRKNPKPKGWRIKNLPEPKIKISPEEMKKLYWDDRSTQYEIAKRLKVCQSAISQFMTRYNISNRGRIEGSKRLTEKGRSIKNRKISKALKGNTNWRYSHDFPNSDELTLIRFFARNYLPFEYVGDGSFLIDGKCPDFVWKEKKLIIEFFGDIWHRSTDEPSRIKFFDERGWKCLVIWGREIRKANWEKFLLKKILRFINA